MSMDYGHRKKRKMTSSMKLVIAGCVVLSAAVVGYFSIASFLRDRDKNVADAKQYGPSGAPCPTAVKADMGVKTPELRHGFDFGDMHLVHSFGDADCAWISTHGGTGMGKIAVCRFTSPASLEVQMGKTDVYFAPGMGKPAAIVQDGDQIRCLLTAKEMG
jgi:hypothetical protein